MRFLVLSLLLTPLILGGCVYIHTTAPRRVYYYEPPLWQRPPPPDARQPIPLQPR
jgi:hypothetical protein